MKWKTIIVCILILALLFFIGMSITGNIITNSKSPSEITKNTYYKIDSNEINKEVTNDTQSISRSE